MLYRQRSRLPVSLISTMTQSHTEQSAPPCVTGSKPFFSHDDVFPIKSHSFSKSGNKLQSATFAVGDRSFINHDIHKSSNSTSLGYKKISEKNFNDYSEISLAGIETISSFSSHCLPLKEKQSQPNFSNTSQNTNPMKNEKLILPSRPAKHMKPKSNKQPKKRNRSKNQVFHKRSSRNVEQMKILRRYLTVEVVRSAVHGLHEDRIRPLLADVYQRVKHESRRLLFDKYETQIRSDATNGSLSDIKQGCKSFSPTAKQLNTIYDENDPTVTKVDESEHAKNCQIFLDALDVYILFVFIRSECQEYLHIDLTELCLAPCMKSLVVQACEIDFYLSEFGTIPELIPYINQLDVELIHPPPHYLPWIDLHDTNNPYDELAWRSFGAFLTSKLIARAGSQGSDTSLMPYHFKGGRYGLALELKKTEFPALTVLSLGELCHLVQLAINGRLLAYEHSVLQPVASCLDLSGTLLRQETTCLSHSINQDRRATSDESLSHLLIRKQNSNTSSSLGSIEHEICRPYETVHDFAADLNKLLLTKPGGLVTAQLKKAMLTEFKRTVHPQKFGHKKLTDFLTTDPIVMEVCQILCLNPLSDCLLMIHHNYLTSPAMKQESHRMNLYGSNPDFNAASSDCLELSSISSPTTTAGSIGTSSMESPVRYPTQKKPKVDIPELTLKPVPSLLSITFNAWAMAWTKHNSTISKESTNSNDVDSKDTNQLSGESAKIKYSSNDDDADSIFRSIYNLIQTENYTNSESYSKSWLKSASSIYASYWDCFDPTILNSPVI